MQPLRRATTLVTGLLLAAALTACGSSSSGGSSAGVSPSTSATNQTGPTVVIKDFKFTPSTLNVKVGTTVTFVQEDSIPHNATGTGSDDVIKSASTMTKGQTYTVTFTKAGTYPYMCSIHPFMTGTVVVT